MISLRHPIQTVQRMLRSRATRESGLVFSGNLANKALTFLVHLVVIRTLSVREFALFGVAVMVLEVLVELSDLGLNLGLVRNYSLYAETNRRRANSVVRLILRAKLLWTFVLAIALYYLAPFLCGHLLNKKELTGFAWLAAAGLPGTVLVYFLLAHLQAARLFFRYVFLSLFGRVLLLTTIAFLAFTGHFSLVTAVTAFVFVPFVTVVAGFLLAPRDYLALRRLEPGVGREVFHFGKWMTLAAILTLAYMRLDVFMLTALSTEEQTAYFIMAVRVASLIQTMTQSLTTALLPHVGRFQTPAQARTYLKQVFSLAPALLIAVAAVVLAARPLLVGLLGPKAQPAVNLFRILTVAYSAGIVSSPAALILLRANRVELVCLTNAIQLIACFFLNLLFVPRFGAMGAALVALFLRGLILSSTVVFVWWTLKQDTRETWEAAGPGGSEAD